MASQNTNRIILPLNEMIINFPMFQKEYPNSNHQTRQMLVWSVKFTYTEWYISLNLYTSICICELICRLFVIPHYSSPVADISLIHSRKRNRSVKDLNDSMKRAGVNKVYICATMWHENRVEMVQILQSIFRYCPFEFNFCP